MKFAINQIYDPGFNLKHHTPRNIAILHQHQDQESGIEQHRAAIQKRKRDLASRIAHNVKMADIVNTAKKNLAEGNIIKVGINKKAAISTEEI